MLKLNYFLADIFILSAEKQPIKLSWRKIEWLPARRRENDIEGRRIYHTATLRTGTENRSLYQPDSHAQKTLGEPPIPPPFYINVTNEGVVL